MACSITTWCCPRWRVLGSDGATTHRLDLADLAAAYLVAFTRSQGFRDGNKRTGLACALVVLALTDAALHVYGAELYAITMRVATNQAGDAEVSSYLRQHMR